MTEGRNVARRQERILRARTDYVLVVTVAALVILGLMMVYSSTFDMAYVNYGNSGYFFWRQLVWAALGLTVLIVLARVDYHVWQRWAVPIMAVTLLSLGVVLIAGSEKFGAQRWLLNGSVQPSEFAKLSVVIYVAAWASSKGERIRRLTYGLIPFAILIGLVTGLILLQRDLSTAALIAVTAGLVFFFAGADLVQLFAMAVFGLAAFAFSIGRESYRLERVIAFLNPRADPEGGGFQVNQALIALASGGVFGRGLGAGRQKFGYVPAVHTDTIMAILGEELGLVGCLVLIGLFVLLAYRGFRIALRAPDAYGTLLAAGLTCSLVLQALINIAVVTATLPYAGVPLPFISYGGSSLLTSMASVGLLLSISRGNRMARGKRHASVALGRGNRRARVSPAGRR